MKATISYEGTVKTIYFNKNIFQIGKAVSDIEDSDYNIISNFFPVTVISEGTSHNGILEIESVLKNDD